MSAKELGIFAAFFLLLISGISYADDPLRLTTDQTKIIHLDQDAANVIVNNPEHADVTLDSPRLMIITPHQPGATSMTVLDADGKMIMEKDIIVTNVQKKYVRIRRECAGNDASCTTASYSYCPDGCYEVTTIPMKAASSGGGGTSPPPTAAPNTISGGECDGEPATCAIGAADSCPPGLNKVDVSAGTGNPGPVWSCRQ